MINIILVLESELSLSNVRISRGFIKELRIHIPWTALTSEPIQVPPFFGSFSGYHNMFLKIDLKGVEITLTSNKTSISYQGQTEKTKPIPITQEGNLQKFE